MTWRPTHARRAAILLALGAVGLWGWILATGGVVRRPPPKLERAARASVAPRASEAQPARASSPRVAVTTPPPAQSAVEEDPRARLAALARRIEALEHAAAPKRDALDGAFAGALSAGASAEAALDETTTRFLASAPFEGVRARAGLRVANFGGRLYVEGEELVPGALRLARIDSSGVVLAGPHGDARVPLPTPRTEEGR